MEEPAPSVDISPPELRPPRTNTVSFGISIPSWATLNYTYPWSDKNRRGFHHGGILGMLYLPHCCQFVWSRALCVRSTSTWNIWYVVIRLFEGWETGARVCCTNRDNRIILPRLTLSCCARSCSAHSRPSPPRQPKASRVWE